MIGHRQDDHLSGASIARRSPASPGGTRVALVVATSHGPDHSRRGPDPAVEDARELESVLTDPAIGAFTATWLVNRTIQEIRLGIEDFLSDRTAGDQMLLYLSGPAMLDGRNRLFFAGTDTRVDRLASTWLGAEWLAGRLDECASRRQIVIVDTDFSGAFVEAGLGLGTPLTRATGRDRTRAVLTSSGATARAGHDGMSGRSGGPSPFTGFLAFGLRTGEADADADGLVTVDEAYTYVCDHLMTSGSRLAPRRRTTGSGGLVLARNPHDPTGSRRGGACRGRERVTITSAVDVKITSGADVVHAVNVAQALDPDQALAVVQGLDAAQIHEVAQVLDIAHVLEPEATRARRRTDQAGRPGRWRRRQIGEALVESGVLTAEQLERAFAAQRESSGPRRWIGAIAVELGLADELEVAECLARALRLELIDLSKVVPAPDVVRLLPRAVAERIRVLVIDRTPRGELVVAASDPTNVLAFDDVRLYTRSTDLKVYVATDSQIRDQLNRAWSLGSDSAQVAEIVQEVSGHQQQEPDHGQARADEDAPIVRLVSQILRDAVRSRASDIHIEVQRDTLRVRYRVDGLLRDVLEAPRRVATSVISRIKITSGLDIAERRIPQDGRTRFTVEGAAIDARVSTLPSLHGEKVVIRLLARGDAVPSLPSLGLEPGQLQLLENALAVPQGLILITGPTGSGKTNTLYSAIARICSPELNIVTLEDPVEVQLPGITQVGVSEKTGMTFSRGLRSILRQDPDIILVGEVRDGETAQLALKAAMTGHMVLTTLHTNSAVAALTRLVDMGAEPFIIASSLTVSVAQRLVRRPCRACAAPYRPDSMTLSLLGLGEADLASATPCKGTGCQECGGTGYRGRTAIYEVLTVDTLMRQVLLREPTEAAIATQAQAAGMVTLRTAAILKALGGKTTFEEAVRVTAR